MSLKVSTGFDRIRQNNPVNTTYLSVEISSVCSKHTGEIQPESIDGTQPIQFGHGKGDRVSLCRCLHYIGGDIRRIGKSYSS